LAQQSLGNLAITVSHGSQYYENGKALLQVASGEYDQAVIDLTASIVSDTRAFATSEWI